MTAEGQQGEAACHQRQSTQQRPDATTRLKVRPRHMPRAVGELAHHDEQIRRHGQQQHDAIQRAQLAIPRQRRNQGGLLPVREIERRVIPTMGGAQYLGFLFDPQTNIYTLKFLRNGTVIWVDVDGRTGRILRRTG